MSTNNEVEVIVLPNITSNNEYKGDVIIEIVDSLKKIDIIKNDISEYYSESDTHSTLSNSDIDNDINYKNEITKKIKKKKNKRIKKTINKNCKKNIKSRNNEWTTSGENKIRKISEKVICYIWLHNKSYNIQQNEKKILDLIIILSTFVVSIINILQSIIESLKLLNINIFIGIIGIIITIISIINFYDKNDEKIQQHKIDIYNWDNLNNKINLELIKTFENRNNMINFIKNINDEYSLLEKKSSYIEERIINNFKNFYKNNFKYDNMEKPDIIYQINGDNDFCTNLLFNCIINNKKDLNNSDRLYNFNPYFNNNNDIELNNLDPFINSNNSTEIYIDDLLIKNSINLEKEKKKEIIKNNKITSGSL